jgi:spermidine synthase
MRKPYKPSIPPLIYLAGFLSGVSCLIYELVWSRYLTTIFGASVYAIACVAACFMLGLGLGSWGIGKIIDKYQKYLRILVWLELSAGVYGLLSPIIFSGTAEFARIILQNGYNIETFRNSIRLILSFLILIVPTFLLGGTFPIMINLLNSSRGQDIKTVGKDTGSFYSMNTLGGVVGAFSAGFILIQSIGIRHTIYLASLLNFGIAGLLYLFRNQFSEVKSKIKPGMQELSIKLDENPPSSKNIINVVLVAFALSGFTSLAYEVLWTKTLTLFFRDSIYDFTIVLTAFLSGIVIGSFLCSIVIGKIRTPVLPFAWTQVLIGIFALFSLLFISRLPYISGYLESMPSLYSKFGNDYWNAAIIIRFGYAFLVMLIPTCLLGATFPLVSKIVVANTQNLGYNIGLINAINTIGATLGSLLAGFVFIVVFGIQKSIILMGIINIGIGLLIIGLTPFHKPKIKLLFLSAFILIASVFIFLVPRWDKLRMSTFILEPDQPIEKFLSLLYYHEDAYGLTSVAEFIPQKIKILTTNRLYSQNTSAMMGLEDHRRLGHIPMLLHKNPTTALMIGLGAGISLRGASEHNLDAIDCVEISEGIMKAAHYFDRENNHVLDNPKIKFIIDDGRNFLSINPKRYDIIIGDIFFPMSCGSNNMFSREYFALCKKHLQPGGLMCQWLPVHQLSLNELKIIIKTFKTVFPGTSLWYGMIGGSTPVIGCIGMENSFNIDFNYLQRKYGDSLLVSKLQEPNLDNPYIFLSNFVMSGNAIDVFTSDQPMNTDDHPVIEFSNPKLSNNFQERGLANLTAFSDATEDVTHWLVNVGHDTPGIDSIRYKVNICRLEIKNIFK